MATAARDRLATLLGGDVQAASSMQLHAPVGDIRVEVEGIGRIQYPVTAAKAKKLITLSAPARFGRGEKTLTDPEVRDTWEVPKGLVTIKWDKAARENALADVREGLGLPWNCELDVDFHSMLVYETGQFFVTHQDSEKDDSMIGTLVVTLPSAYTGGDLLIGQGEEWKAYKGSKTAHTLVAFYADRQHEVLPVKTGYRVTLTYNLLMRGDTSGHATGDDATIAELAHCLTEHFSTPGRRYYSRDDGPPNRLVYLLDHEYTPRGLSWSRLKGPDASRCDLLRAAANKAGCEVILALADVKETHSAYDADEYYERGRYSRYRDWDDDLDEDEYDSEGEDEDGSGEYVIEDLVNSEVELTHWLAPEGKRAEDVSLHIWDHEVCASTSSGDLKPYASEYEGNMGNYGNTLDRWYKRGALIVWPCDQAFANRAEASPAWAMDDLDARARSGNPEEALAAARTLEPFWETAAHGRQAVLLPKTMRVATALRDAGTARMLLRPFQVESLLPEHAAALAELGGRYGTEWGSALLEAWFGDRKSWGFLHGRRDWALSLPAVSVALNAVGASGATVARLVVGLAWEWLRGEVITVIAIQTPSQRERYLAELGAPLAAILVAAARAGEPARVEEITDFVRQQPHEVIPLLLAALRDAADLPPDIRQQAGFSDLARGCAARLRVLLGRPWRADDDWSIQLPPGGCTCELCSTLKAFLASPTRRAHEWPLATDKRHHIHSRIDAVELPVTHVTRRTGRPYTLVLTKTQRLFDAEREARARDAASLEWLATEWDVSR
jgi:hypothetical protein